MLNKLAWAVLPLWHLTCIRAKQCDPECALVVKVPKFYLSLLPQSVRPDFLCGQRTPRAPTPVRAVPGAELSPLPGNRPAHALATNTGVANKAFPT